LLQNIVEGGSCQDYTISLASAVLTNEICCELNRSNAQLGEDSCQTIYQYLLDKL
jgi:hypothetical protein